MKALIFILLIPTLSFAQQNEDKKIMITLTDTTGMYNKVKVALVRNDFLVKEDGSLDTLSTYPRELRKIPGFAVIRAEVKGNTVTLSGAYGLKKIDDWGYTNTPKNYKPIIYYKGSKGWALLQQVANTIGRDQTYSK